MSQLDDKSRILDNEANLFITRRRKRYKFAYFRSLDNSFFLDRHQDGRQLGQAVLDWLAVQPGLSLTMELAAGSAQLSLELARRYPERRFVAIDIKSDRLYTAAKLAQQQQLTNIAFVRAQLGWLLDIFAPQSVDELWLTFPDPYPKQRAAKHRLTQPAFLKLYQQLLKPGSKMHFKTDNLPLFHWSLEQLVTESWRLHELSFDLHQSVLTNDYKITTSYEQRFMAQGLTINFCTVEADLARRST